MEPIVNFSGFAPKIELEALAWLLADSERAARVHPAFPRHMDGMSIFAMDDFDGTVYHTRNLDFSFRFLPLGADLRRHLQEERR